MSENQIAYRVVSSFTATPVGPVLTFWAKLLELPMELTFAPYGQVLQELQRPSAAADGVIVLLRMEDFVPRSRAGEPAPVGTELAVAVAGAARRTPGTSYVVAVCPRSPAADEDDRWRRALDREELELRRQLAGVDNVGHLDPAEVLERYAVPRADDSYADRLGGIPYTPEYFAALGTALMRRGYRRLTPEPKVLVVDGDNTLWDGVLAEDGPQGVQVGLARQELQNFLIEQREAGRLLCLSTKNDLVDVTEAFAAVPGMRLAPDDFVRMSADWRPKSAHVRELADDLGLALESFVFIDDSPIECAEVRLRHPEVNVLLMPPDASRALQDLRHCWPLDIGTVTEEASRRTALYHQEGHRRDLRSRTPTLAEFIDSLELTVTVRPPDAADLPRMADLMRRTTQFNLTARRYGVAEIEALPTATWQHVVGVRDRFGDYGTVGLMMSSPVQGMLDVEVFLVSCRALGRGVEHRMLAYLGRHALGQGLGTVRLKYVPTARNQPVRQFLTAVGFPEDGVIAASEAAETRYDPDAAPGGGSPPAPRPSVDVRRLRAWQDVAPASMDLTTARGLRRAIAGTTEVTDDSESDEQVVRRIWAEILHVNPERIDGDFRSSGGGSLELVHLLSSLYEEFDVELPVEALLDNEVTVDDVVTLVRLLRDGDTSTGEAGVPWVER